MADLEQIKKDIIHARAWARKYFKQHGPDGILDPPTFKVNVGARPDEIIVWPRIHGRTMQPGVRYRLCWKSDGLYWKGYHPFHKDKTWLLKITQEIAKEHADSYVRQRQS